MVVDSNVGSARVPQTNHHPEKRICDPPAACGVARSSKWRVPFHRIVRLAAGPQLRFSGHQMGGQERQLKMDKSRRLGGFTNSTAFSRINGWPLDGDKLSTQCSSMRHGTSCQSRIRHHQRPCEISPARSQMASDPVATAKIIAGHVSRMRDDHRRVDHSQMAVTENITEGNSE